jgi:hypothetical protein
MKCISKISLFLLGQKRSSSGEDKNDHKGEEKKNPKKRLWLQIYE